MSGLYSNGNEEGLAAVWALLEAKPSTTAAREALHAIGFRLASQIVGNDQSKGVRYFAVTEAEEMDSLAAGFLSGMGTAHVSFACLWADRITLETRVNNGGDTQQFEVAEIVGEYIEPPPELIDHLVILQGSDIRASFIRTAILRMKGLSEIGKISIATPVSLMDARERIHRDFRSVNVPQFEIVSLCEITPDAKQVKKVRRIRDDPARFIGLEIGPYKGGFIPQAISQILEKPKSKSTPEPVPARLERKRIDPDPARDGEDEDWEPKPF